MYNNNLTYNKVLLL